MESQKRETEYTILVSDQFGNDEPKGTYEIAFRRWLVRELESGHLTISEAVGRFNFHPRNGRMLLSEWRKRYASEIELNLPLMTEKERHQLEALQKQVKELEKQLEKAQMKTIALETLIDVAEEDFKIPIRKKGGTKQ